MSKESVIKQLLQKGYIVGYSLDYNGKPFLSVQEIINDKLCSVDLDVACFYEDPFEFIKTELDSWKYVNGYS